MNTFDWVVVGFLALCVLGLAISNVVAKHPEWFE